MLNCEWKRVVEILLMDKFGHDGRFPCSMPQIRALLDGDGSTAGEVNVSDLQEEMRSMKALIKALAVCVLLLVSSLNLIRLFFFLPEFSFRRAPRSRWYSESIAATVEPPIRNDHISAIKFFRLGFAATHASPENVIRTLRPIVDLE